MGGLIPELTAINKISLEMDFGSEYRIPSKQGVMIWTTYGLDLCYVFCLRKSEVKVLHEYSTRGLIIGENVSGWTTSFLQIQYDESASEYIVKETFGKYKSQFVFLG